MLVRLLAAGGLAVLLTAGAYAQSPDENAPIDDLETSAPEVATPGQALVTTTPFAYSIVANAAPGQPQVFVSEQLNAIIRKRPEVVTALIKLTHIEKSDPTGGKTPGYINIRLIDKSGRNALLATFVMPVGKERFELIVGANPEDGQAQRAMRVLTENNLSEWPPTLRLGFDSKHGTFVAVGYFSRLIKHDFDIDHMQIVIGGATGTIDFAVRE